MSMRILSFLLSGCLFSVSAWADRGLLEAFFIPQLEPRLAPVVSSEHALRERIHNFLAEYRVSNDMVQAFVDGVMLALFNQYGSYAVSISDHDLVLFLMDRLGIPRGQRLAVRDRVLELERDGRTPRVALLRAVLEYQNIAEAAINECLLRIMGGMRNGSCFFEAYWNTFFWVQGLNDAQAERAGCEMGRFIREGTEVSHAYWHCMLQSFGFDEHDVNARVLHAVDLVNQGLSLTEALSVVLFDTPIGVDPARVNVFRARIGQSRLLVEAFYFAHYSQILSPYDALVAAQHFVLRLDEEGFQPGRFERIIYEQYGFPESLAQAAVNALQYLREQYPDEEGHRLFWRAAFRVLGLRDQVFPEAYRIMLNASFEGVSLQRAFEHAYIWGMGYHAVELGAFFEALDQVLRLREGVEPRVETFLDVLWGALFLEAPIVEALDGFLQSPSSLLGILALGLTPDIKIVRTN